MKAMKAMGVMKTRTRGRPIVPGAIARGYNVNETGSRSGKHTAKRDQSNAAKAQLAERMKAKAKAKATAKAKPKTEPSLPPQPPIPEPQPAQPEGPTPLSPFQLEREAWVFKVGWRTCIYSIKKENMELNRKTTEAELQNKVKAWKEWVKEGEPDPDRPLKKEG